MSLSELALEILRNTNDGDDLDPRDLKLVEHAVNGFLNAKGEAAMIDLHARATAPAGYMKPWFHGIKHLSRDLDGYIYWKNKKIEHFSFSDLVVEQRAAERLANECRTLEAMGITPTWESLQTSWMTFGERPHTEASS